MPTRTYSESPMIFHLTAHVKVQFGNQQSISSTRQTLKFNDYHKTRNDIKKRTKTAYSPGYGYHQEHTRDSNLNKQKCNSCKPRSLLCPLVMDASTYSV